MAEDVTHHLPQVLLSIPVLPLELLHTLLNGLLARSLQPMERFLRPCPKAIQAGPQVPANTSRDPLRAAYACTALSIEDSPSFEGDCGSQDFL